MRHMLLFTATMALWTINVAYIGAIQMWPHLRALDEGQRLLLGVSITVTFAWMLNIHGIEYRIGYRNGRQDKDQSSKR